MQRLEHKVPPPIVMFLCALGMWFVAAAQESVSPLQLYTALVLALLGIAIEISGVYAFHKHRTTINPLRPSQTSTIVQTGPYRFTRNPMYLGMAMLLAAFALYLGSFVAIWGVILFIAYIQRFQIVPEERILGEKLGQAYKAYKASARRWI